MSIFKFLNPHEKAKKYAKELKDKCRLTNDGKKKKEPLTASQDRKSTRLNSSH